MKYLEYFVKLCEFLVFPLWHNLKHYYTENPKPASRRQGKLKVHKEV